MAGRLRKAVPAGLGFSAVVYLLSRIPVAVGLAALFRVHPSWTPATIALRSDGWWYVRIARVGYTASLRPALAASDFHHKYSEWAFFPGYPLLVRGVHELTRLPFLTSALGASWVLGFTTVWALYSLGRLLGGVQVGRATALLVAAWPGSVALSLPYSEGMFLTATALSLICLHRQRWLWAGALGAVALLTRPTGLALLAAMAVVAAGHLVRSRDWRPVGSLVLTASGGAAFLLYGWVRTGDPLVWRHAENLWGQSTDFSAALLARLSSLVASAPEAPHEYAVHLHSAVLELVGLVGLLGMCVAAVLSRQPKSTAAAVYALVVVALILVSSSVGTRPRMVLAVLPGFVCLAAWLPRRLTVVLAACFLGVLTITSYLLWQVTP